MRRRLVAAVAFLFIAAAAHTQDRGAVDWIFLVDTSKSMRGIGGTKDIFDDVKQSIATFVREANDGDSVAIFTFDGGARLQSSTPIRGSAREDLYAIVNGLEANGDRTHLGLAIAKGLERAESLRATSDKTRVRAVVLFTDGKEDVRGIADPIPISSNVQRVADSFVFFVSMGEHEPQLDAFATATPQTTVLKAPEREHIARVAQEIRAQLPRPEPPPPEPPRPAVSTPSPPAIPPSPLIRAAKWAATLALLLAIAFIAFQLHRRKNRLEGEIEILQPRVAPDAAYVGLPKLEANEIALSAIVPLDALAGSDARLFVRRTNGAKKVWISAQSGSMRINDVETPMSELYDADTIRVGDATLRFNRVGHERAVHSAGEDL
jgi:hypothetical protein